MYSEKAIQYAKNYNNANDIAYANIMLGSSYMAKSDYSNSLNAFQKALDYYKNTDNYYQLHTIYNNLGIIYKYSQEYELSLHSYTNALNYAYKENDLQSIVQSLTNIGNLYVIQENFKLGLKYYNDALEECRKRNEFIPDIPPIYNNIGYIYFYQNKLSEAKVAYQKAEYYYDSIGNIYGKAVTLNNLAEIEMIRENYNEAEKLIQTADSLHIKMSYNESRKNLYYTAYQLYSKQNKFDKALLYLEKFTALKDSIYTLELNKQITEIKTKYEVDKINIESREKDEKIKQQKKTNLHLLIVIISITSLIALLLLQIRSKLLLNFKLNKLNALLKLKDDEITLNINYARQIQLSCMSNSLIKRNEDFFVLDLPKFGVGGDFYILRKSHNKTTIALGDCTGHGISGGFLSVLGIENLNYAIDHYPDLQSITIYLNTNFFKYITSSKTLRGESMSLSLISIENNIVKYIGSKQKIWKIEKSTGLLSEFKTGASLIGENIETSFSEQSFTVAKGDIIFLSSDGFPDQFGQAKGEKLKYSNFRNLLKHCASLDISESEKYLQDELTAWQGDLEQTDDILVIGIKI